MSHTKQFSLTRGFTLIETLVSISILAVVVITPMTIAYKGIQMVIYAEEETTAVFLAQEALESVIRVRDDNALDVLYGSGSDTWDWVGNLPPRCTLVGSNGCDYVVSSDSLRNCIAPCKIKVHNSASSYQYLSTNSGSSAYSDTAYERMILVSTPSADSVEIEVTVSWDGNLFSGTKQVVLRTQLFNHYNRF